jgi:hypothetical protein
MWYEDETRTMKTYLFGYSGHRLTLDQMATRQTWAMLHAEFRRRLIWLFDLAQSSGTDLGIGEGWRSSDLQRRTFLARHAEVRTGGCCNFEGKRYALIPPNAHAAPPGLSFHESAIVGGKQVAMAADLVGDLAFGKEHAARAGLVEFSQVNREPWHFQPSEIPISRARYDGRDLTVWNLTSEVDMIVLDYKPGSPQWVATLWTGETLGHIVNGHADVVLRSANVGRVTVNDDQFLGVINSSATVTDAPAGMSSALTRAWNARRRR